MSGRFLLLASLVGCVSLQSVLPRAGRGAGTSETVEDRTAIPAQEAIRRALDSPIPLPTKELPLKDFARLVSHAASINVLLDQRPLEDAGIADDSPVLLPAEGLSLRASLRLALAPIGVTYTVQDEVILLTTPDAATSYLETRVYPIASIVADRSDTKPAIGEAGAEEPASRGERSIDSQALVDAIEATLAPSEWSASGGQASITSIGNVLVVAHRYAGHEELSWMLEALRTARAARASEAGREPIPVSSAADREFAMRAHLRLRQPISVQFDQRPLGAALAELGQLCGLPIVLDRRALEDAGIDAGQPVRLFAQNISAGAALDQAAKQLGLVVTLWNEVVYITTPDGQAAHEAVVVYGVSDLLGAQGAEGQVDAEWIIDLIKSSITPTAWAANGGEAEVVFIPSCDALVVRHIRQGHEQLAQLLGALRRSGARVQPQLPSNEISLRVYQLDGVPNEERAAAADELCKTLVQVIDLESWRREGVSISAAAGRLFVQQTNGGHRQIARVLREGGFQRSPDSKPRQQPHGAAMGGAVPGGDSGGFF